MVFCCGNISALWHRGMTSCLPARLLTVSPHPRLRPHDNDPVLTDVQPSPRPSATPHPDVQPLTPPLSILLDRELQEAFQECEEQMASLGILSPSGPPGTKPETVHNEGKKTGEVMVKKSNESSSLPPPAVQPGHSNGGHGDMSIHGNSEAANSRTDTVVFSFRDYILGIEKSAVAGETESDIKTQSLDKCSEMKTETEIDEQKETPTHTQLETTDLLRETPKDVALSVQRGDLRDKHVDSNAAVLKKSSLDCSTVISDKCTEVKTEIVDIKKEKCKESSVTDTTESSYVRLKDNQTLSEMQTETQTGARNQEDQESKTDHSPCDKQAGLDKKAKKKEKKKQRKKKKIEEKNTETGQKAQSEEQPENNSEAVSLTNVGAHTESMSQADTLTLICGQQPDCGFGSKRQLSPEGESCPSPPPSSSHSRQDHLTDLGSSPVSNQALYQRPLQSENHKHADAPCDINHSSEARPQRMQHATGAVIDKPDIPMTHVQTTVINPAASTDKRSESILQEAILCGREQRGECP
ncbi:protein split ends-like [Eleginops maclovinus]|uniref:protein split ends-like n=1 Tax=Eleginops maclovinus TaxID=56733 RepID=UPI0030803620